MGHKFANQIQRYRWAPYTHTHTHRAPAKQPPQGGGGMAPSTTSSRRRRVALPSMCMLLQQYSLDHKAGHAHSLTAERQAETQHLPPHSSAPPWLGDGSRGLAVGPPRDPGDQGSSHLCGPRPSRLLRRWGGREPAGFVGINGSLGDTLQC
jgi:hypothetical protein